VIVVLWLIAATSIALAKPYPLADGTTIMGEPVNMNDEGVQFKADDETVLARTPWDKLTPAALLQLNADAKSPHDKGLLAPLVDYLPQPPAERKEIPVKPITPPVRPTGHLGLFALFGSPVGLVILLILYAANLFAAYEVAIYRIQPVATVCGLAAIPFFGVLSPIIYLAMPGRPRPEAMEPAAPAPTSAIPITPSPPLAAVGEPGAPQQWSPGADGASEMAAPETATAEPAANLPQPIVFSRGEFMFNRRFFETKFAGFFRVIPTEAEKDLVLLIKSSRGEFVGRHISRTTQAEFYLQVFKNDATAEEMIPFSEVLEVQIRHKDTL
ncbi:MAG: hypothetical protein ACLQVW_20925, partial [Limisphaerales bacterium]